MTNNDSESARVVAFLSDPGSHRDRPRSVDVIETHISWVFLTDRYAYKLKKPVRFEFLDFSTPELRQRACQEELRLNRRLAPDVYLNVLGVTQAADGSLELDGRGSAVDWVVQMRRLPADRALDALLRNGRLESQEAGAIAGFLVDFYAGLPPRRIGAEAYRRALEQHVRANGEAFAEGPAAERGRMGRIQSAQLRYLAVQADDVEQRAVDGRIVDGHGDLRPEHIYLNGAPAVIDCIEFSEELRTVDIADELSFLAMECERLGDGGVGELVLKTYADASGDRVPPSLLDFYRAYRACVRAKVALLRREQKDGVQSPSSELFGQYVELAERHAAKLGPPAVVVVGGLMGTGKSTLAERLAEAFGVEVLATDRIRRALLGTSDSPAAYGEGNYRSGSRRRVYEEMFRQASAPVGDRESVILDGAFLTRSLRRQACELARRHGAVPLFVECDCPRATARERIESRAAGGRSESEARAELYDRQAQDFEPPGADEPAVRVDTTQEIPRQLAAVYGGLRRLLFE